MSLLTRASSPVRQLCVSFHLPAWSCPIQQWEWGLLLAKKEGAHILQLFTLIAQIPPFLLLPFRNHILDCNLFGAGTFWCDSVKHQAPGGHNNKKYSDSWWHLRILLNVLKHKYKQLVELPVWVVFPSHGSPSKLLKTTVGIWGPSRVNWSKAWCSCCVHAHQCLTVSYFLTTVFRTS